MLKNLLKTWGILAPDEVAFGADHTCILLKKNTEEHGICSIETTEPLLCYEQDTLQGYIQRCIEARKGILSLKLGDGQVDISLYIPPSHDLAQHHGAKICETLITAYLTALAAQRPIAPGTWRHFKGDAMDTRAVASWTTHPLFDFCDSDHSIEESPEEKVTLHLAIDDIKSQSWGYHAFKDYGDRVFYRHDGKNWARKAEDFLGLVGPEHPESEGLLRFVEAAE